MHLSVISVADSTFVTCCAKNFGKTQEYASYGSFVPKAVWNAAALCLLAGEEGVV